MVDLSRFRIDGEVECPTTRPVAPVLTGRVLAVDQTLNSAGWAMLDSRAGIVHVREVGVVAGMSDQTGHAQTLEQGAGIFEEFRRLIERVRPDYIVHEYPPVVRPGLKMQRPESSLVAANSLRNAALLTGTTVLPMVNAQQVKRRFTGNTKATKKELGDAVMALDPSLGDLKPMNEHVRDAIALGWAALEREQG
jgi:Holliday junction resolvasome RuvABC endonuclease subunit